MKKRYFAIKYNLIKNDQNDKDKIIQYMTDRNIII